MLLGKVETRKATEMAALSLAEYAIEDGTHHHLSIDKQ